MPMISMSEKYQRPDHIRVVKAVCVEYGNNDDTWKWRYPDVRETLTKAKELLMKLEQGGCLSLKQTTAEDRRDS